MKISSLKIRKLQKKCLEFPKFQEIIVVLERHTPERWAAHRRLTPRAVRRAQAKGMVDKNHLMERMFS